jgi:hypothetical protein
MCRIEAERRFSSRVLADGYEQIYQRVIAEQQGEELMLALGAPDSRIPITL